LSFKLGFVGKIFEGLNFVRGFYVNVSPSSSVSAIGATFRDIFFPPETHASLAAMAGMNNNFRSIDKLQFTSPVVIE